MDDIESERKKKHNPWSGVGVRDEVGGRMRYQRDREIAMIREERRDRPDEEVCWRTEGQTRWGECDEKILAYEGKKGGNHKKENQSRIRSPQSGPVSSSPVQSSRAEHVGQSIRTIV